MSKATILIIEDDRDILRANCAALELEGYRVLTAETLSEGEAALKTGNPDLILLDVMLPDGDGIEWCRALRGVRSVRVLFLSALDTKEDALRGLRAGGDDYITKPYLMDELLVRAEVLLRRPVSGEVLQRGPLRLEMTAGRAFLNDTDMQLTRKECAILLLLTQNAGQTVTKDELYRSVWGVSLSEDSQALYAAISRLKKKLAPAGEAIMLTAVRQEGYCLEFM